MEYSVNIEFQEETIQLADALDLDELASAALLLNAQEEVENLDRSPIASAIICFHESRQFTLECLRLVLRLSTNVDLNEELRGGLCELVIVVLETKDGPAENGSCYVQKCFAAMSSVENWLQELAARIQRTQTLGQTYSLDSDEIMSFHQQSLNLQHESLAAISTHLITANHTLARDFHKLLDDVMPVMDKWNSLAVHYVPILLSFTSQYGSRDAGPEFQAALRIHEKITDSKDSKPWALPHLQAAFITWWSAEFNGYFIDAPVVSPPQRTDQEGEGQIRSELFMQALRDGALQCTLTICSQTKPKDWYDPARNGLTDFLLQDAQVLPPEVAGVSPHFRDLIMEQFEIFAEAFITNMPDTLRRFKVEEDDQRRRLHSGLQGTLQSGISEHDLHLERFLVIMSYAYEHHVDAAASFWSETDSNLYGFLQWASKRQSTPRVSAFCEMFRALSEGDESALAAHRFLLEESPMMPGRLRRSGSLSWAQIFGELDFYASKVREHPMVVIPTVNYSEKLKAVEIDEPESAMMLECYLRLTSHLCIQSDIVRSWIMTHESFHILDMLFLLCSNAVPKRIRACAYDTMRALLTDKTGAISDHFWTSLDLWVSGGFSHTSSIQRPAKITNTTTWAEEITFETIANDFEEANAFVALVQALVRPAAEDEGLNDALPFPEQLGSSYRMPGVEPYIDFVLGNIFAIRVLELDDPMQLRSLTLNTLNFAATCLATFNEDLLILANGSNVAVDKAMNTSSLLSYSCLHPFSRVMEWMFNERVLAALFSSAHQDIIEINNSLPESPLILALLSSIEVMSLIMDLQSTYLDIVRPLIRAQTSGRRQAVINPSLTSFEDSVASNLRVVVDLSLYCGSGHPDLVLLSLKLLGKFSSSRKLNAPPKSRLGLSLSSNRLIGILEQNNDLEPVSRSLLSAMEFDDRELSRGPEAPGYIIKLAILDFLDNALIASPERPNLAHALLGFSCTGVSVYIDANSLFAKGLSLFHAILRLITRYPEGADGVLLSWFLALKQKGVQILRTLWKSTLTSVYTMMEMRAGDFLFEQFLSQDLVDVDTLWDGQTIRDRTFIFNESASALEQYFRQRRSLFEYASAEIRLVAMNEMSSLREKITATLLGSTTIASGEQLPNPTTLDLLDFINLDLADNLNMPFSQYFAGIDFEVCVQPSSSESTAPLYNLKIVKELLALRHNELLKNKLLKDSTEEDRVHSELHDMLLYFHGKNNLKRIESTRIAALDAWVDLVTLFVQSDNLDREAKAAFVLRALQSVSPQLEKYAFAIRPEALIFAKLASTLLFNFNFKSAQIDLGGTRDLTSDRLHRLFRIALRGISVPDADSSLREVLYDICYRYITVTPDGSASRRNETQLIKSSGEKFVDIICDDAYGGEGTCRIAALLLLDALTTLTIRDKSSYLIDSLTRTNFVVVLVESIKDTPNELRESDVKGEHAGLRGVKLCIVES